jgi:copper chaperone CopZ
LWSLEFWRSRINNIQQPNYQKAYLSISDIECKECFNLIQGIILPIKGIREVSLEDSEINYKMPGSKLNRVVISYDPTVNLNQRLIRMALKDWNFDLQKIEI